MGHIFTCPSNLDRLLTIKMAIHVTKRAVFLTWPCPFLLLKFSLKQVLATEPLHTMLLFSLFCLFTLQPKEMVKQMRSVCGTELPENFKLMLN